MIWRSVLVVVIAAIVVLFAYGRLGEVERSQSGEALADVTVPQLSPVAVEGEALFNASCAQCHGTNAAGQDGIAPPLVHIIYEPNHHADAAFLLAVKNGVRAHHWRFGDMPPVEGVSDEDATKIVAYVRELQRANGID